MIYQVSPSPEPFFQDSLLSKKVYQHMLKRTQREQAILKQKLFQMEEIHVDLEIS